MTKKLSAQAGERKTAALTAAQAFVKAKGAGVIKLASALRKAERVLTAQEQASIVSSFKTIAKTATELRAGVRSELRTAMRTAAEGDDVDDSFADTSEALSEIINLAETALDQVDLTDDDGTGDDDKTAADADDKTAADADDKTAADADDKTAAADKTADDKTAADKTAAAFKIPDIKAKIAAFRSKKASERTAEEVLDVIVDALQDLTETVSELAGGEEVTIDDNGVVTDSDPDVDTIIDDGQTVDDDEDELTAALNGILAGDGDDLTASDKTASSDPWDDTKQKDPLAGKTAAVRTAAARAAARNKAIHDRDEENLALIAKSLVR